jgi:hypothetical protein
MNVLNIYKVLIISVLILGLVGCGTKSTAETPVVTKEVNAPAVSEYPQPQAVTPIPVIDDTYPGPLSAQTTPEQVNTGENFVTNLVIPTPNEGKAVITGQLLIGGEGGEPYIATLYLGPTVAPSTPTYPPMISFSEDTDLRAIQDVDTGRFVFTDVAPGQYAIILWTPYGGNPLVDENEATVMFSVSAGEVKDLGILPIK